MDVQVIVFSFFFGRGMDILSNRTFSWRLPFLPTEITFLFRYWVILGTIITIYCEYSMFRTTQSLQLLYMDDIAWKWHAFRHHILLKGTIITIYPSCSMFRIAQARFSLYIEDLSHGYYYPISMIVDISAIVHVWEWQKKLKFGELANETSFIGLNKSMFYQWPCLPLRAPSNNGDSPLLYKGT